MEPPGSVTVWITQLKTGHRAAQRLWETFVARLATRARRKLAGTPRRAADEEDVVLSTFDSFCRAAEQSRFPQLEDRDDLWQLLVLRTDRKASNQVRHERQQRRGGGTVLDEGALAPPDAGTACELAQMAAHEPSPEFAAQLAEEWRLLLRRLPDADLHHLALRRMEGYSVAEIAAEMGWAPRTVKRRPQLIRSIWQQDGVR